ncbi:MAG: DUF3168 domain-containing protein [Dehalococcoidia bacterium]|jgi:hypothetical protein
MTVELAFVNKLLSDSGVTALVGNRIYSGMAPEGAKDPFVVFFLVNIVPHHASGTDGTLKHRYYQFSAYSKAYDTAKAIASALCTCLQDFTGVMGGSGGVTIDRIFLDNGLDHSENGIAHISQDFEIWYRE